MTFAVRVSEIFDTPVFLSTVTPGKLPTFWLRPVSALKRELLPLLGFPTNAIVYGRCMQWAKLQIDNGLNPAGSYNFEKFPDCENGNKLTLIVIPPAI